MAVNKIYDEIKKLSPAERQRLKQLLNNENANDDNNDAFERAAGSWRDFDAEGFVKDIYKRRSLGTERAGAEW